MNTVEFFDLVLPKEGFRCVAVKKDFGYSHQTFDRNRSAAKRAIWLSGKSETVFFSNFSLNSPSITKKDANGRPKKMYRVRENLAFARCFWLDLDVGEEANKYDSQQDAVDSLMRFVTELDLPRPLIVNSGYGIHSYFVLSEDIEVSIWHKVSDLLHSVVCGYGLKADPSRTRDSSSVLRPVGTWNRKHPESPQLVTHILSEHQVTSLANFANQSVLAIKANNFPLLKKGVSKQVPTIEGYDDSLSESVFENKPVDAIALSETCLALKKVRETQGNVQEPLWYAMIGLLLYVADAEEIIHEWSEGHPGYSFEETQAKIEQRRNSASGPTTCAHVRSSTEASELCKICPFFGSVTTPLQLVKEIPVALAPPSTMQTEMDGPDDYTPKDIGMFQLTATAVIFKDSFDPGHKVEEESKVLVLDYPMILKASSEDERRGGVIEIEYKHPMRGTKSFYVEKAMLAEKATFYKEILKNHIAISAGKAELLKDYMVSYLQELDRTTQLQNLYSTMGWKSDDSFVLGTRLLKKDCPVAQEASLGSHLADNYCNAIKEVGNYANWVAETEKLNSPALDKHALALCFGFGAPLMSMTGYDGALVNLLGPTNSGKSTMLEWITSIFGDYKDLKAQKGDTYNQMMGRLGTLNNLPMVIDEITNIDQKEVSDLVYSISQGREKARMTSKIVDRKPRTWNTIVISSSNSSLIDKLMMAKADPEAERMRVVEFWLPGIAEFEGMASSIHPIIKENFGGIGTIYIQYVLNNYTQVKEIREVVQQRLEVASKALGKERFWVAALSTAIAGGLVAKKLGLIRFDMAAVFHRASALIQEMRGSAATDKIDYTSSLGRYLNAHSANVMLVRYCKQGSQKVVEAVYEPQRELIIRVEHNHIGKRIFVDKRHFLSWLGSQSISTTEFAMTTKKSGLLLNLSAYKVLGEDWANNPNNASVPTLEFYMRDDSESAREVNANVVLMAKSSQ